MIAEVNWTGKHSKTLKDMSRTYTLRGFLELTMLPFQVIRDDRQALVFPFCFISELNTALNR